MKLSDLGRCILSRIAALAMLAGCGGPQSAFGPPPWMPWGPATARNAEFGRSWMAREAKSQDLVYVSDYMALTVSVFSWSGKLLGTLTGFGQPVGLCSDTDGNVFVADSALSDVVEYAHGGSLPIKTLIDSGQVPVGCAVDSKSGNLAVTNLKTAGGGPGSVSIYAKAKGKAKIYSDIELASTRDCGYDDKGNLFVDGFKSITGPFAFAELRGGRTTFTNISVNRTIEEPVAVQWDGKYITVEDTAKPIIYRLQVSGSKGKIQGSTRLEGASSVSTWIQGGKVVGANFENPGGDVMFWRYPAGGGAIKMFGSFEEPVSVTVSVPPRR